MKSIKVAMIGCGGIALAKHLPALKKIKNVELVAFMDTNYHRAKMAAEQFGTSEAICYSSWQELLHNDAVEVVHICTPNAFHAEISIAALNNGKHVMCEKPMALNSEQAKLMIQAAKKNNKFLTIGFQNRFRAECEYLKQLCDEGALGEIYFAKAQALRRRDVPIAGVFLNKELQGGGPLIDIGSHALDLTLWCLNNYQPKYVVANTYHQLGKRRGEPNVCGEWDPEQFKVEDSAFGMIVFENQATLLLESSWALNTLEVGEAKTHLSGSKAGADMHQGLIIHGSENGKLYEKVFVSDVKEDPGEREIRLWIESIEKNIMPRVTMQEALVVTQIIEAMYLSAQEQRPVYFKKRGNDESYDLE